MLQGLRDTATVLDSKQGSQLSRPSHLCVEQLSFTLDQDFIQSSEFRSQVWSKQIKNIRMSYERILSIENLNDVPNPWKGFSMNRCLVVALVVLLVSSGVNEVHGLDYLVEETGIMSLVDCLQTGSLPQFSIWDSVTSWWGSEELGVIRRRKKPIGKKAILKPKAKE
ncbi:uncharacterized protein FYW61_003655 isoform 2-T2 [Anableps anableps]